MTVLKLTMTLLWKMITFQVKPTDLVVRDYHGYCKNIVFVDCGLVLPEHICQLCKDDPCSCDGIHHRMFGKDGDGPPQNLVCLD